MPDADPQDNNTTLADWASRGVVPSTLSSAEWSRAVGWIKRQSVFSAHTDTADYLQFLQDQVAPILAGDMDNATVVMRLKQMLEVMEYHPSPDDEGTIKDLSSWVRRKLVVETNVETARGAGQYAVGMGALDGFPAWELIRVGHGRTDRDWGRRWLIAAQDSGDTDALRIYRDTARMIALKTSPQWTSLGSSDLFTDALGNPFAPFAFNSHMRQRQIAYSICRQLGLVSPGQPAQAPQPLEFQTGGKIPAGLTPELRAALLDSLGAGYRFDEHGVLTNRVPDRALPPRRPDQSPFQPRLVAA